MRKAFSYSNIHKIVHKLAASTRFPLVFALFCLGIAAAVLAMAQLLMNASLYGTVDFHTARRIAPMLADSSAITAVVGVGGGVLLERMRQDDRSQNDSSDM